MDGWDCLLDRFLVPSIVENESERLLCVGSKVR